MSEKTPGQINYEEWARHVGRRVINEFFDVCQLPYECISDIERSGWEAAAKAVRNLPAPHGTISAREERWCDYCGGEGELYFSSMRKYDKCLNCSGKGKVEAK